MTLGLRAGQNGQTGKTFTTHSLGRSPHLATNVYSNANIIPLYEMLEHTIIANDARSLPESTLMYIWRSVFPITSRCPQVCASNGTLLIERRKHEHFHHPSNH